jgi:multidrug efflux pump subunit AcrB
VIADGLNPGDRIVAEGVQKVRTGAHVIPSRMLAGRRGISPMSKFFINRPIVAMVIALLMVIVGGVAIATLPVAQFPALAPPEVQIRANYVGADAQTIEQSVATPIEQQMSGVDNLNYMYSLNAAGNGQMTMIVDFDVKSDPNTDLILTQMRETQAASQLPQDVTNFGVTVQKSVTSPLMVMGLFSPKGTYDGNFLANYSYINLNDQLTSRPRHRQRSGIRRRPVRDASVGQARPAWPSLASL